MHVEMYDGRSFCGEDGDTVGQHNWHEDAGTSLVDATCLRCLSRLQALGEQAAAVQCERLQGGHTVAGQGAIMAAEQAEREQARRQSGAPTLTLASFDGILKERYQ